MFKVTYIEVELKFSQVCLTKVGASLPHCFVSLAGNKGMKETPISLGSENKPVS